MSDGLRLRDHLGHILEAIERIERYTEDLTEVAFLSKDHELVQDAVIRNFEVIGEASRNIEKRHPEFLAAHAELPLLDAYDMPNALANGYFKVDLELVWDTMQQDLPKLHERITGILQELPLIAQT